MEYEAIIGIDPGTDKFGVALVDLGGRCKWRSVEPTSLLTDVIDRLAKDYPKARVVLGDGTGSQQFGEKLRAAGINSRLGEPIVVDERHSTELARRLYLTENRRGWRRFVPIGLQTPDIPVDGYVAEVLARRYLEGAAASEGKPEDPDR